MSIELRFLLGFALSIIPALTWVGLYFGILGTDQNAVRWFWGNATFSVHHPVCMPVCIAIFFATADFQRFLRAPGARGRDVLFRAGIPLILLLLVFGFLIADALGGKTAPYDITDSGKRAEAFKLELELRAEWSADAFRTKEYREKLETYSALQDQGMRGTIGWANTALTAYYAVLIGAMHWYLFLLLWDTTFERIARGREPGGAGVQVPPPFHVSLIFAYSVWLLWLPLRIYANWFELHFVNPDWRFDHAAVTLITVLSFLGLVVLFALSYLDRLPTFLGILGALTGVVGTVVGWLNPEWLREFSNFSQALKPIHYLGLLVVVVPVLTLLGLYVVATHVQDTN